MKPWNKLTDKERHILLEKGTERPFSGEYNQHYANGIYVCRQCEEPLYRSYDKFKSSCGWPSFDEELPHAISKCLDEDGRRTEITCQNCGGHLGHVFSGERLTEKNIRHCVNSLSLKFIPFDHLLTLALKDHERYETLIVAGGCFWGVEYFFEKEKGVLATAVGYSGGQHPNPTYEQVCSGTTDHAESVAIVIDKGIADIKKCYELFFDIHDPTQLNQQGPDKGSQYRSAVFYSTEQQKKITEEIITHLKAKNKAVVTQVEAFKQFWIAEDHHQKYFTLRGQAPTCHFKRTKK